MRTALAISLIALAACSTATQTQKTLSIFGRIEFPLVTDGDKYWLDAGPFFVASKNPLVAYRVISKEELEFIGSEKSAFEFFKSSFSNPEGLIEESFRESHKDYAFGTLKHRGLDIYLFSNKKEARAYVSAASLSFVVDVYSRGENSKEVIETIIKNAKFTEEE